MNPAMLLLAVSLAQPPAEPQLIVRPDAFQTLVNPTCSHCIDEAKRRAADLRPDDRVLAWTRGKYDGGAIPVRFFLAAHRVISDTYGTFVFDPDAGFARAFPASLDYRFHGWRNGVMVMKHKDGTLFSSLSGVAFDGPRKGERLPDWPTIVTDWGWYAKHYPGGVVYQMHEKFQPVELTSKPSEESLKSRLKPDPRLSADAMVLGIDRTNARSNHRAYPLAELEKLGDFAVLPDTLECGNQVVVLWQASTRTAAAYVPMAERRAKSDKLGIEGVVEESKTGLQLVADGKSDDAPFLDKLTGTRFDISGRGIDGALKGWTLTPYRAVMVKWYAWAAEYPTTVIKGK